METNRINERIPMTTSTTFKDSNNNTIEIRTNVGVSPRVFINGAEWPKESGLYQEAIKLWNTSVN